MASARVLSIRTPTSMRGMTARYAVALGLVGLLSVVAFISLRAVIHTQSSAAAEINLSGRQRMLSQRLSLDAQRFMLAEDAARPALAASIIANADLLAETHVGLVQGSKRLGLPGNLSPTLRLLYHHPERGLDPVLQEFLAAVRAVVDDGRDAAARSAALARVLAIGPAELLDRLDAIVKQYQLESETDVRFLMTLETVVMVVTICILILEAAFIFAPMVRRVQSERAGLIRAEHNQRAVIEASQDGIVTLDERGRITRANPAVARLFGSAEDDLIGRSLAGLLGVEEGHRSWGIDAPTGLHTYEHDGRWIECSFGMLRGEVGMRVMAVLRESTERLQTHMRRLERKNRQLDQFAYAASHDLKAPLRAISNLSTWIAEDLGDELPDDCAGHLQLLRNRVQRLERLITGLHTYASAGQGQHTIESVVMHEMIAEVLHDADHDGRLEQRMTCDVESLQIDRALVWQVLSNLVNNAVKHHGEGPGWVAVDCRLVAGDLVITVADDGPGIDPAQQDRIFDIFHTLRPKDETGSLGLGLALVKRIVEDIGGEIQLESMPGAGSTFTVTWPLVGDGVHLSPQSEGRSLTTQGSGS